MPRVLMIEDDFDFAEIMLECLQADPSCEIEEIITNEADAKYKLECGVLHGIDAVLVDLQLPRSKFDHSVNCNAGLEIIYELRRRHRFNGRIIVLTNSHADGDGQKALDAGCDGYLCKHTKTGDLPTLITELRMAIRGDVVMFSREMQHIFVRNGRQSTLDTTMELGS